MYPRGKEVGRKVMQIGRGHSGKLGLYSNYSNIPPGMLGTGSWEERETI